MENIFLVKIQNIFCVCSLGITTRLNFSKSNVTYFQKDFGAFCCVRVSPKEEIDLGKRKYN